MSSDEPSGEQYQSKAVLRAVSMRAVLGGTVWYEIDRSTLHPRLGGSTDSRKLSELLEGGRLFSIEVEGRRLVPDYAFDKDGEVLPQIAQLVRLFAETTPQRLAAWLESTNSVLDGHRPRELLIAQPDLVIAAAGTHLRGPLHG